MWKCDGDRNAASNALADIAFWPKRAGIRAAPIAGRTVGTSIVVLRRMPVQQLARPDGGWPVPAEVGLGGWKGENRPLARSLARLTSPSWSQAELWLKPSCAALLLPSPRWGRGEAGVRGRGCQRSSAIRN